MLLCEQSLRTSMSLIADLALVFGAGLITALATGLGALPFFFVESIGDRWTVALWGLASGIMLSASVFGLLDEGLAEAGGEPTLLILGIAAGVALVVVADRVLERVDVGESESRSRGRTGERADDARPDGGLTCSHDENPDGVTTDDRDGDHDHAGRAHRDHGHDDHGHDESHDGHDHGFDPATIVDGDLKKLLLILGVLTVHSFPEGVAIGVSFAELGFEGGVGVFGFAVPLLAVFMTVAISVHNIPEGLAISIPLESLGVSRWRMVGAAIFSSLPQPIGAVIAFLFVRWARAFLPFGFGLAAGAMVYLVVTEFVPEALEHGADLPGDGRRELAGGIVAGTALMLPLLLFG